MDGDWEEVSRLPLPPPGINALPTPVIRMAFDTSQELLWAGNDFGRVSSFSGIQLQAYTSFKVGEGPVRQILIHDRGVIVLTSKSVHMALRRGPPIWHIAVDDMKNLQCMSYTSRDNNELLVAGFQDQMFVIDVDKGILKKQVHTNQHFSLMRQSRYICAATQHGTVYILDSTTFAIVKTWNAHSSLIGDMDAQHDYIVTCGFSLRQGGAYMPDAFVNVYDLKKQAALPPIPFPAGAAYVRMHPKMSTTSIVLSQHGQMHVVDLMNVNTSNVRHANTTSFVNMLELSPSGQALAMADAECAIHLWGSPSGVRFAEVSNPIEYPDEAIDDQTSMDWSVETPLNTIGMPYYRENLLSAWPSHMMFEIGAPPQNHEQLLPVGWQTTEWGTYGRNTSTVRRNQVVNTRATEQASASLQAPKFLSQKARESANDDPSTERRISDVADAIGALELSSLKAEVPVMYRNVEIKYSKFGVDDFDFGFYNKTPYSGLEIHISNSYANPLLQVLHFTPLIRNLALSHAATACVNDMCLLCELGYLFDMLEKAEGSICQATNLLKTFGTHPQAAPLKLLEEDAPGSSLTTMLQGLNRFLLDRIAQDYRGLSPRDEPAPIIDHVLTMSATTTIRCMNCRGEHTSPGTTFVNDLVYPVPKLLVRNPRAPKHSFSQILKFSIEKEQTSRGWCLRCTRYQSLATKKTIHDLPAVLMLNAAVSSPEARQYWSTPGWLPEEIGIILDQGQFYCYEGEDLKLHVQRQMHNITLYSLVGLAADIDSGQHQKSHLVSLINVAYSLPEAPTQSQWHLFNDFLVRPIKAEEALSFNTTWKLPSVITYQVKTANNIIDNSWKEKLDTSLLYMDPFLRANKKYRTLVEEDAPGEGTLIALDTEFVAVRQPEIEMNSDGERETIRPIVYALARVSVIRGSGEDEGLPFIDDYIATKEPIVDYLTSYSGIVQGDLDPRFSKHNLVSLKVAYKKLWILSNLGCKFLGHGLKQDFRVTNIHIPKAQVIDTSDFFFVKARLRKLSLSFLAWYLLKENIQLETHDSIEDARTALKIYRKYLEFQDAGVLDTILADIYRVGRDCNFKPPPPKLQDGQTIQRTETPPIIDGQVLGAGNAKDAPSTPARRPAVGVESGLGWTPGKGSPLR